MRGRSRLFDGDEADAGLVPRRQAPESELDITPMIDVTFLLLVFFMVTSTMQSTPDLDVPVAKHATAVETARAVIVRIEAPGVAGTGEPVIRLDDDATQVTPDDVQRYVERNRLERPHVVIKADREVPHGFVKEVTRAVTSVKGVQFYVGVRDERSY